MLARQLDDLNRERRGIQAEMQDSALRASGEHRSRAKLSACRYTTRAGIQV
jgi:hypothetical protein